MWTFSGTIVLRGVVLMLMTKNCYSIFSFNVTFSEFCRVDEDYFTKRCIQHFNISTLHNTSLKLFFFLTSAETAVTEVISQLCKVNCCPSDNFKTLQLMPSLLCLKDVDLTRS